MCHGLLREASPLRIDVDHSGTIEISEFIGPLSRLSSRNAFNAMQLSLSLYSYSSLPQCPDVLEQLFIAVLCQVITIACPRSLAKSLCFTDLLAWLLWHCVACLFSSAAGPSRHGCPRPHSCSNPSRMCRLLSFFKSNFDGAPDVKFRQMLFQRRSIPSSFLDLLADGRTTRRQLHVSSSASEALFEDLPSRYNMLQTMLG